MKTNKTHLRWVKNISPIADNISDKTKIIAELKGAKLETGNLILPVTRKRAEWNPSEQI